jgi:hypothetical protein
LISIKDAVDTDFLPYLNQSFVIQITPEQTHPVELISVTRLGRDNTTGRPFSIIFRGAPGVYLPQQIYPISHEQIGTLELFIVPIQPDQTGMRFEAVFN